MGQDGIAIERGEVALDELVRVSPLERFVPLQGPPLRLHEVVPGQDIVAGRVCDRVPGFKSEALVHYRGELLRPESRGVPDLDDPPLDVKRGLVPRCGVRPLRFESQSWDSFLLESSHDPLELPLAPIDEDCSLSPRYPDQVRSERPGHCPVPLPHVWRLIP